MKLHIRQYLSLLALSNLTFLSCVFANPSVDSGKFYIGAFGGAAFSDSLNVTQFGTAFFTEAQGGPLSVNAPGKLDHQNSAFWGIQLGLNGQEIVLYSSPSSRWALTPGIELEGYSMNKRTFNGDLFNNTDRLSEHDFLVSYPMNRTVFLTNIVLNFNSPCLLVRPYLGFGIGNAILRIADANALQVEPAEEGVNHYNSNSSDTTSAFAGQIKFGVSYALTKCLDLFADYRWLYIESADFELGPTIYSTHVATSSWHVRMDSQRYNLVNIGLRLNY